MSAENIRKLVVGSARKKKFVFHTVFQFDGVSLSRVLKVETQKKLGYRFSTFLRCSWQWWWWHWLVVIVETVLEFWKLVEMGKKCSSLEERSTWVDVDGWNRFGLFEFHGLVKKPLSASSSSYQTLFPFLECFLFVQS
jgi:hypothetical protein